MPDKQVELSLSEGAGKWGVEGEGGRRGGEKKEAEDSSVIADVARGKSLSSSS